jgi:lysozyme family protein
MSDLTISIGKTLIKEGGYINNAADPGGATKYGVTQKDITGLPGFPENVKDLTVIGATEYYREYFWNKFGTAGRFAKENFPQIHEQTILDKLFDLSVLFGLGEAVDVFERVLSLPTDGIYGPNDVTATNEAEPSSLLTAFKTGMVAHAIGIANAKPSERIFLQGWINRVNS